MDDLDLMRSRHSSNIIGPCMYIEGGGVDCDKFSNCLLCGWNPAVADSRKMKIRDKMKLAAVKPKKGKETWLIGSGAFPPGYKMSY